MRAILSIVFATAATLTAIGARAADTLPVSAPSDLASLLEGEFTTLPAPIQQSDTASQPQTAAMMIFAKRVDAPAIGRYVVYSEIRQGGKDGKIRAQRIYSLSPEPDSGRISMVAYNLPDAQSAQNLYASPAPIAGFKPADLKQLPAGCEIQWHRQDDGFAGDIAGDHCDAARLGADGFPPVAPHVIVSKEGLGDGPKSAAAGSGSSNPNDGTAKALFFRRLR